MRKHILFAAIAALFFASASAQTPATPCLADDHCILGCPDAGLGTYSISAFSSMAQAQTFVASLSGAQQETVRTTTAIAPFGPHIIVVYRVASGVGSPSVTFEAGACQHFTVTMASYSAIETAEVDLNQLPAEQRAGATLMWVSPVPNDLSTRALLLVMRRTPDGVHDASLSLSRNVR